MARLGMVGHLPVIVEGALPGETVDVKIIKNAQNYDVGKLVSLINASEDREDPFCDVYNRCGGCSLQHLRYDAQLCFKTERIRQLVSQNHAFEDVIVRDTLGMETPLHYRNKALYPVGHKKDRIVTGFYARHSHEIIEHAACAVQPEVMSRIITHIRTFLMQKQISVYDERAHTGILRHIMLRAGFQTGEIMVVVVVNGKEIPYQDDFVNNLISSFPDITSIILNTNTRDTNVILGQDQKLLYSKDTITDVLASYRFEISARSFYQVNSAQTQVLYQNVLEYADLTGKETVFDLYCGIGTLSSFLASSAKTAWFNPDSRQGNTF